MSVLSDDGFSASRELIILLGKHDTIREPCMTDYTIKLKSVQLRGKRHGAENKYRAD